MTEDDEIFLRAAMPGWLYIDTRDPEDTRLLKVDSQTHKFSPVTLNDWLGNKL